MNNVNHLDLFETNKHDRIWKMESGTRKTLEYEDDIQAILVYLSLSSTNKVKQVWKRTLHIWKLEYSK